MKEKNIFFFSRNVKILRRNLMPDICCPYLLRNYANKLAAFVVLNIISIQDNLLQNVLNGFECILILQS